MVVSRASGITALLVVVLFCQAMALKCYQAPLSWDPCWKDPSGEQHSSTSSSSRYSDMAASNTFGGRGAGIWIASRSKEHEEGLSPDHTPPPHQLPRGLAFSDGLSSRRRPAQRHGQV